VLALGEAAQGAQGLELLLGGAALDGRAVAFGLELLLHALDLGHDELEQRGLGLAALGLGCAGLLEAQFLFFEALLQLLELGLQLFGFLVLFVLLGLLELLLEAADLALGLGDFALEAADGALAELLALAHLAQLLARLFDGAAQLLELAHELLLLLLELGDLLGVLGLGELFVDGADLLEERGALELRLADALLQLAAALAELGQLGVAAGLFELALQLLPEFLESVHALGGLLDGLGFDRGDELVLGLQDFGRERAAGGLQLDVEGFRLDRVFGCFLLQ